jgi:hypothetical protein
MNWELTIKARDGGKEIKTKRLFRWIAVLTANRHIEKTGHDSRATVYADFKTASHYYFIRRM